MWLLFAGETCFATAVLTIDRFVTCLDSLDVTFSSAECKNWSRAQTREVQAEMGACRAIVNDVTFTSFLASVAEFFDPVLRLLRMADSDAPNVSKMVPYSYNAKARMQELAGRGDDEHTDLWNDCVGMYIVREGDLLHPVHFAGYAVDPEFRGNGHKQLASWPSPRAWKVSTPSPRRFSMAIRRG